MEITDELKERFEAELNKMFEPNAETPLWACIQLSGDVGSHIQAMHSAYQMDREAQINAVINACADKCKDPIQYLEIKVLNPKDFI